ncbi:MAG TPA: c-type cytochrome biogenesis protein CcsB [Actinomycetes bacterium]|nr:c-type cytochrome biogenesis protein CcsB [Actinomycetes bacterium]
MVNETLAGISYNFVVSATAVYALALFAYVAEWAFGARSRVGRTVPELVMAGGGDAAVGGVGGDTNAEAPLSADGPGPDGVPAPDAAGVDRAERLGRIGVSLTVLAAGLHLAGVLTRGLSVGRVPWGNMYEFVTAGTLVVVLVYLALLRRFDARWLGLFVTMPVLLALGAAVTVLYVDAGQLMPALHSVWLVIHVAAAVIASGCFTVGAVLTLLYLGLDLRARRGLGPAYIGARRLPDPDVIDRLAYRVFAFAFPIWTFAVIAGAIWAENAWGRYWGWDPKETWSFITWVVFAGYLHARVTAGWKGRAAAMIALVGIGCLLFNLFGVNIWIIGKHSYAKM